MQTVLRVESYRVHFYSHEPNEPPHVHVDRDDQSAKFWLDSVALARNLGFSPRELRRIERILRERESDLLEAWVSTSDLNPGERVKDVGLTEDMLRVDLIDGRTILIPLAWYPRLLHALPAERQNWEVCGGGFGIHWPDLDEDLSTEGLLRGAPAPQWSKPVLA